MSSHDVAVAGPRAPVRWRDLRALGRKAVFVVLAGFILLSPAPGQLFDQPSPWLREWVMYSGVGTGIPAGDFHILDEAGAVVETLTPLQAAGLSRYPNMSHYLFEGWMQSPDDLWRFAAAACAGLDPGRRLSFDGRVGTRQGWQEVQRGDICALQGDKQ